MWLATAKRRRKKGIPYRVKCEREDRIEWEKDGRVGVTGKLMRRERGGERKLVIDNIDIN
jgi:hypothetical protein